METQKRIEITDLLAWCLGGFFVVLAVLKATSAGFTHDESHTWLYHAQESWLHIINFTPNHENNHIFNTLLMKVADSAGLTTEWGLRLPNLLAGVVFSFFAWKLGKQFGKGWLIPVAVLVLVANPYLLDFFALARGYGLSLACGLASIYHFLKWSEKAWTPHYRKALIWAAIGAWSQFTLLPLFLIIMFWHNMVRWLDIIYDQPTEHRGFFTHNVFNLLLTIGLGALWYEPLRKLLKGDQVAYGEDSFWGGTVDSLSWSSLYDADYSAVAQPVVPWVILGLVLLATVVALIVFFPGGQPAFARRKKLVIAVGLLWSLVLYHFVQYYLLDVPFSVQRMALIYMVLFGVMLMAFFDLMSDFLPAPTIVLGLACALLLGAHTVLSWQRDYFRDWKYDANVNDALIEISDLNGDRHVVSLGNTWVFEPTLNYYRESKGLRWLPPAHRQGPDGNEEFLYLRDLSEEEVAAFEGRIVQYYPTSNSWLIHNPI